MKLHYAFGLVALMAATPVAAQDCPEQTQMGLNLCYAERYKAADATLNATYRSLTKALAADKQSLDELKVAQRAWIAFRDADCQMASASARGGSMESMLRSICLSDRTSERVNHLRGYLLEAQR